MPDPASVCNVNCILIKFSGRSACNSIDGIPDPTSRLDVVESVSPFEAVAVGSYLFPFNP